MLRLVINLDRSIDRWQYMDSQFRKFGIPVQRVSAIDAKKESLPLDKIAPLGSPEKYFFPRELSRGEIACYLSHIKCWESLLATDEQWAVIFEDDALLSEQARNFVLSESWVPSSIHIAQLHTYYKQWRCRTLPKPIPLGKDSALYNVIEPCFGTCCYIIDRTAAKVALDLSQRIAAPIDEFLFNYKSPFAQQFPSMRLNPACIYHNREKTSTLGVDRYSPKRAYSLYNHLSPRRLYLSAKKNLLKRFFCVDTIFTWK